MKRLSGLNPDAARRDRVIALRQWIPIAALLFTEIASAQSDLMSRENVRAFRLAHPCPLTGLTQNACPGWVIALIKPRCAAGTDDPSNMQWLTTVAAAAKGVGERDQCPLSAPLLNK